MIIDDIKKPVVGIFGRNVPVAHAKSVIASLEVSIMQHVNNIAAEGGCRFDPSNNLIRDISIMRYYEEQLQDLEELLP